MGSKIWDFHQNRRSGNPMLSISVLPFANASNSFSICLNWNRKKQQPNEQFLVEKHIFSNID